MSKSIANGIAISAASLLLFEIFGMRLAPAQQTDSKPPVVEGDWVRTDTNGSGSFDHLLSTYKQASLTPEGQAMMAAGGGRGGRGGGRGGPGGPPNANGAPAEPHVAGQPYVTNAQTC